MNPHTATEAIYSATYVDNYIDSVENLPNDVQRHVSRIRDIDVQYRNHLREVDHFYELLRSLPKSENTVTLRHQKYMNRIQHNLCRAQELGDEKMQIVNQLQELIDQKTRQLDIDQKNLDIKEDLQNRFDGSQIDDCGIPIPSKQARTQSPGRSDQLVGSANNGGIGTAARSGSCSAGGSTPNSERSGHIGNGNTGANGVVNNIGRSENQRYTNKRSRRRNDTVVGNMDFGGNESNSGHETGTVGGLERNMNQKSNHKKNHNQGGNSGNVGSGGATGSGAGGGNTGKKKKRKARGAQSAAIANTREETPPPDAIDPDEPTYCVCNQISFGEMILCDNDLCPIEWFHFSCVSLVAKPKGKWFCPNCRGDRPNVMKPKAQFLKELERYNKEKEEKT